VKYAWIKAHSAEFSVAPMCDLLDVSRSGYYSWINHKPSKQAQDNEFLDQKIREIHHLHQGRYGAVRILKALLMAGIKTSFNRVKRRLNVLNIKVKRGCKFKLTTDSRHTLPIADNILNRDFTTTGPNQKWVGDITYIPTHEGWLYLAVVIDLYSRKVIGWSMSHRINKRLVCDALLMALWARGFPKKVIMHTDRGSQYCSGRYQKLLKTHHLICSMSRKANCWDNAIAESFFKTLKAERVDQMIYQTREVAKQDIFEYIEAYYNQVRLHSSLDFKAPNIVEWELAHAA
jgi:putative transposase